jgi:hypothetical protein
MISIRGCYTEPHIHQQNQVNLDSLDRAVQRSIEPQKLQKGALLYSSAQYPEKSVQICVGLSLSVGLCTEWPKMETCFFLFFVCCYIAILFSYTARRG